MQNNHLDIKFVDTIGKARWKKWKSMTNIERASYVK